MSLHIGSSNISDIYVGNSKISDIYVGNNLVYTSNKGPDLTVPLYFEANDPTEACTVKFEVVQTMTNTWNPEAVNPDYFPSVPSPNWAYSYDRNTWTAYTLGTDISLGGTNPDRVYFKTSTEYTDTLPWRLTYTTTGKVPLDYNTLVHATISGSVKAQGNVMSLVSLGFGSRTDVQARVFESLFADCPSLTEAPMLPATTLAEGCYYNMFYNCTSLTAAPMLPAATMEGRCYSNMFSGCTSLTEAPDLPATTLAPNCYNFMFHKCTSLTEAPVLPASTLAEYCYSTMFSGCTSLTSAPELPATTLANFCYQNMFQSCASLTSVPALPATTLANFCYQNMFTGLRGNNTASAPCVYPYRIPESGTGTAGGDDSLSSMFTNIDSTGTFTPTINTTFYISVPAAN